MSCEDGQSIHKFKAKNIEDCLNQITQIDKDWKQKAKESEDPFSYLDSLTEGYLRNAKINTDVSYDDMILYEISDEEDILPYLRAKIVEIEEFEDLLMQEEKDLKEKEEYERLKMKFEK